MIKSSLIAFLNPTSEVAEQYRTIRNHIRFASGRDKVGSLVVTSPSGAEGKSVAAVNLAITMAQRGDRVLLIDANIRKPVLHVVFNVQSSTGLMDVLANKIEFSSATMKTDIDGLSMLPSGSFLHNSMDLLGTKKMASVLEQAAEHYDAIILDCSPVLGTPEASDLASRCDGVVLVVNSGKTQQEKAIEASRTLELVKANIVGVILNNKKG
ncbi:CpsD/CapB family tyrosine-protein kinase [Paenibacillus harenae]|uniref:non-specific protein-tyrosine kinase n=1 Tax=Paenibacillus harenae TaxID=306543 RepID=A0ABT9U5J1_PAEHA|nr:CpsD/CapB family tyrosine-protein kinase [Paenibacillus harenae]MDQ0063370.1 capsular exopolysaccharide synthesis family protein [Paenibacillus harenae]MDQ0114843.1 capsular exopolysaccharide synthesis family protein [Paenibacillus harenae]